MATVIKEVDGVYDLAMIELQIQTFEACAKKFMSSEVKYNGKNATNHVTFERMKSGTHPEKHLHIVLTSKSLPAGAVEIWKGILVVSGSMSNVCAYRQS